MPDLFLHSRPVNTVFDLLGQKENDITSSLGWTLRQSPSLASALLAEAVPLFHSPTVRSIQLQEYTAGRGITDIKIDADRGNVIVEAKRGWVLPTEDQLGKYAAQRPSLILVLSECSDEYAKLHLLRRLDGVPIEHRSWREIAKLVRASLKAGRISERRVLVEFLAYLETAMPVQDQESNIAFVVSLNSGFPEKSKISWIDIVEKKNCYFHPVGDGWPKEPPNYIAFRYGGQLQAIRHVDQYEVATDPHGFIPEMESRTWTPHFIYFLGPVIKPQHQVRTGKIFRNGRVWAALDLLLTCRTISEARDKTKTRGGRFSR